MSVEIFKVVDVANIEDVFNSVVARAVGNVVGAVRTVMAGFGNV